jgi:transposase
MGPPALHCSVMSETLIEEMPANPKASEWAERIAAQVRSGMSVKQFCKEQGLTEYSFYAWRKRLQEKGPVQFALVERNARRQERTAEAVLELVLEGAKGPCRYALLRTKASRSRSQEPRNGTRFGWPRKTNL